MLPALGAPGEEEDGACPSASMATRAEEPSLGVTVTGEEGTQRKTRGRATGKQKSGAQGRMPRGSLAEP